jgi:hypothetical protein
MAEPPEPVGPQPPPLPFICQSCGMPMERKKDFGTNADNSISKDYCVHCFQKGRFSYPDMTLKQMIDMLAGMASRMNMTEEQVRKMASKNLPKLKRWKK